MTTSLEVFTKFKDKVFNNAALRAITEVVIPYEVSPESESELSEIYHRNEINFFECVVTRGEARPLIGGADRPLYTFNVDVRYTLQKDTTGDAFLDVRNAIETVADYVASQLAYDFGGLVDMAEAQEEPATVTLEEVAGLPCFRSAIRFQGRKQS